MFLEVKIALLVTGGGAYSASTLIALYNLYQQNAVKDHSRKVIRSEYIPERLIKIIYKIYNH